MMMDSGSTIKFNRLMKGANMAEEVGEEEERIEVVEENLEQGEE